MLRKYLKINNIDIADDIIIKLENYIVLLQKWNKVHNLISCDNLDEIINKHIIDSLSVLEYTKKYLIENQLNKNILDVGTGAGLPGIILAICMPDVNVTLIDSNIKKIAFLHQVLIELKIKNAKAVNIRVELYEKTQDFQNKFSIVISRAFSSMVNFITLTEKIISPNGFWFAMKGKYPESELEELTSYFSKNNIKYIKVDEIIKLAINSLDADRNLVVLKKLS
tara:strand:- start:15372 stop:16043 length:672 start_codon:yes stop_codon:yes gene_type:complete